MAPRRKAAMTSPTRITEGQKLSLLTGRRNPLDDRKQPSSETTQAMIHNLRKHDQKRHPWPLLGELPPPGLPLSHLERVPLLWALFSASLRAWLWIVFGQTQEPRPLTTVVQNWHFIVLERHKSTRWVLPNAMYCTVPPRLSLPFLVDSLPPHRCHQKQNKFTPSSLCLSSDWNVASLD